MPHRVATLQCGKYGGGLNSQSSQSTLPQNADQHEIPQQLRKQNCTFVYYGTHIHT